MSNFRPPARAKNALDEFKLRLTGEKANGSKRPPSLAFSVVKNNPRIDVYTNVENDKDNGLIRAAMDAPTFFALLGQLKEAINSPGEFKVSIDNMNYTWYQQKRSEFPVLISTTYIGKDANGMVYLAVTAKDRPKIQFHFKSSSFHALRKADGSEFSAAEDSVAYANAFYNLLTDLTPNVLEGEYVAPEPKPEGGWSKGGGSQGNSGNSGGWKQQPKAGIDDIPF